MTKWNAVKNWLIFFILHHRANGQLNEFLRRSASLIRCGGISPGFEKFIEGEFDFSLYRIGESLGSKWVE
jgi:hypothetical protein